MLTRLDKLALILPPPRVGGPSDVLHSMSAFTLAATWDIALISPGGNTSQAAVAGRKYAADKRQLHPELSATSYSTKSRCKNYDACEGVQLW